MDNFSKRGYQNFLKTFPSNFLDQNLMREESSENKTRLLPGSGPELQTKIQLLFNLIFVSVQQIESFSRSFIYLT